MTETAAPDAHLLVSVIVPVRNGSRHLAALMHALGRQTLPRGAFEVVIVDDGSDEPPVGLATDDDHVRVLTGAAVNSYAARNRGAAASRGEILAFCDADCVPEPDWLEHGVAAVEPGCLVAGRVRFVVPEERTVWTLIDMDTTKNQELLVSMGLAETANLFVRRADFDRVGGFEAVARSNGDYDFVRRSLRAGASLRFGTNVVVWHPTRNSARAVLGAQWVYCHSHGLRKGLRGEPVAGLRIRSWIPVVTYVHSRRKAGLRATLATSWLAENGVLPSAREQIVSLPLLYVVVPVVRNVAQVAGVVAGVRARSRLQPTTSTGVQQAADGRRPEHVTAANNHRRVVDEPALRELQSDRASEQAQPAELGRDGP
jgi:glycosyltransferase involved in cell wall biosynthesis